MASILVGHPVATGAARDARHRLPARETAVGRDSDLIEAISEAATIRAARERAHSERAVPDRMSGYLTGGSFALALGAWLLLAPPVFPGGLLAACVLAHAAAGSIEFEIGPGTALPTTPVLWVSLFLLPPQLVPIAALAGLMIAAYFARLRDPDRRERLPVLAGSAWHSMGPALVFAFTGVSGLSLGSLGIYAVALGAQFGCDTAASWVRNCYGLGVPTGKLCVSLSCPT